MSYQLRSQAGATTAEAAKRARFSSKVSQVPSHETLSGYQCFGLLGLLPGPRRQEYLCPPGLLGEASSRAEAGGADCLSQAKQERLALEEQEEPPPSHSRRQLATWHVAGDKDVCVQWQGDGNLINIERINIHGFIYLASLAV